MKLADIDTLATMKRELEKLADLQRQAAEAKQLGVIIRDDERSARGLGHRVLVEPTDDEDLVDQIRHAVTDWCEKRRHGLHRAFESRGVDVREL